MLWVHSKNAFESDRVVGYSLLRATLGINIFLHGVSRVLAGSGNFAASLVGMFHATLLPPMLVRTFGYALPWIEATVGLLVLLGLWTRYALAGGALLIFVLTFGTALRQDWETAGLQLTYALIFGALLAFRQWNTLSFDVLLDKNRERL
jgi:thiosulfate dehydrogenase [quinone] large subunit